MFQQLTLKEVDTTNKMSSMNIMSSKTKSFYTKKYSHASEVEKFLHRKAFSPASSNKELQQYLIMSTLIFKNLNNMLTLNKILNLISKLNKVTLDLLNQLILVEHLPFNFFFSLFLSFFFPFVSLGKIETQSGPMWNLVTFINPSKTNKINPQLRQPKKKS